MVVGNEDGKKNMKQEVRENEESENFHIEDTNEDGQKNMKQEVREIEEMGKFSH